MAVSSFTQFDNNQKKTVESNLFQVIDVIQSDISGSGNRRKYESFLSSSGQTELTSSLYQTVYDQSFTLQTANPVLDMSVGLFHFDKTLENGNKRDNLVTAATDYSLNSNGQPTFSPSETVMMREKINIYRQYANLLLGNAESAFGLGDNATIDVPSAPNSDLVFDACYFMNVKRLFSRDGIRPETFAIRLYENMDSTVVYPDTNIDKPGEGAYIIADIGGNSTTNVTSAGYRFSWLVQAAAVENVVGIIFYEPGIVVLNLGQGTSGAASGSKYNELQPVEAIEPLDALDGSLAFATMDSQGTTNHKVYPDLYVQGSIDDIVDHVASTRFGSGQLTAMAFQNQTNIQSSIYICRSHISSYNVSNNPTWLPSMTSIASGNTANWFTYITSVALLDDTGEVVAVAKLNRPVYKSQESEVSIRIRLDF